MINYERLNPPVRTALGVMIFIGIAGGVGALAFGANRDADIKLARLETAIGSDGFFVDDMPKSFLRDVAGDVDRSHEVQTVLDLGGCAVEVFASQSIDPATELPDVHDYAFILNDGSRVNVQDPTGLFDALGPNPCERLSPQTLR